jgi:signal transduction histidine kinase
LTDLEAELDALRTETSALRDQVALLEAALRELPAGVAVVTAPSGRLLVASRRTEELVRRAGMKIQSLEDYDMFEGFRPDGTRLERDDWPLLRSLLKGEHVTGEIVESVLGDGTRATQELSSAPIFGPDGTIVAAVGTFEDVSDRERRARTEREFVTNAAHELRTPLTAIASAVEVLQAGAKDDPEARDRFLGHIDRATDRLGRLGRALLILARAQTGQEAAKLEIVPLRAVLESVAAELEPSAAVTVEIVCDRELGVLVNRDLLEQALSNVAGNAARYTRQRSIELAARPQDGMVAVEVTDTGPGLTLEDQQRVTERFYRGIGSDVDGFGLGLSIAAESVRVIGGTFELHGVEPTGTRVRILVPMARIVSG